MKKNMLVAGIVLLAAGFVLQLFPTSDIAIADFPLDAYIVGAISGIGLCLIGFSVLHNVLARNL